VKRQCQLADSFQLGLCGDPHCTALHFNLLDEDGELFAVMTIGAATVPRLTERMRDLAYQIAVTKHHDNE
jgi:hypothetical protein